MQFDLRSLISSGSALALVPALVAALVIVCAAPALMFRRRIGIRPAMAAGLLQATTLTFPVVVAEIGSDLHLLSPATAAALIGAALLSMLLFPALALGLRPWTPGRDQQHGSGPAPPRTPIRQRVRTTPIPRLADRRERGCARPR